ncbi:MAG: OmpH family outer membrane protein [Cytophagaceae bacterium]|jgi:outer membrane protein|nr:OmpH family outer membrane protein [Cytophagaceae bacterium]
MKKFLVVMLSLVLSGVAFSQAPVAAASALKIGYTNLDYILGQLPKTKEIETQLKAYETQLQNNLQGKVDEYKTKRAAYEKGASMFTDVVKQDKEKELIALESSIREFEEEAQTSLQQKQVKLLEPVLDSIQKAIERVADRNGYTYIFSTHADFGGSAIILYARIKEDDISNLVLKELGVTVPAVGVKSATPTNNTSIKPSTPVMPK